MPLNIDDGFVNMFPAEMIETSAHGFPLIGWSRRQSIISSLSTRNINGHPVSPLSRSRVFLVPEWATAQHPEQVEVRMRFPLCCPLNVPRAASTEARFPAIYAHLLLQQL